MEFTRFANKFARDSGIKELMVDLDEATSGTGKHYMLGGGNPARIPAVGAVWRRRMEQMLADGEEFDRMVANYDGPKGRASFIEALAALLRREYGWKVGPENVALTNGSQSAFFYLFNLFAGRYESGAVKKVLFPLVPEYIGYADQSVFAADFDSRIPRIEMTGPHSFKYRINFDALDVGDDIGAICASRPTNPSGNMLTDDEVARLSRIAAERGVPLMLDSAYGLPFPGIVFSDAKPYWDENVILGMSLSKLGLPSARTGIVIARQEVIEAVSSMNAIISLANCSLGQALSEPIIADGSVLALSREVIQPFYRERSRQTREWIAEGFAGTDVDWAVHESEGAIFLWLWLRNLRVPVRELYLRLKARNVVVVPGEYFFSFGSGRNWKHRDECMRINYAADPDDVRRGVAIIAEEAAKLVR